MKATGIVRRIDDLGRVVIPKEIRRTMRIREGDPLEIYTNNEGEVIFKKYSPIGEMTGFAGQYAEILNKMCEAPAVICDRDHVIAAAGVPKKEYLERRVTTSLEEAIAERKCIRCTESQNLQPIEGIDRKVMICCPVICSGDIIGSVLLFAQTPNQVPTDIQFKLTQATAAFLSRHLED
ncbi:MAG: stage V sporulation T C-terminal domain-containing protein [Candidatus Merdivicinus sp.]